jgi:hypothetical protein
MIIISEFERKVASLHVSRELPLIETPASGRADPQVTLTVIGLCSSRTALPTFSAVASTLSRFKRAARNLRTSSFVLDGNLMTSGELLPRRIG